MVFELLMIGVAFLPLVAGILCGWYAFPIAALLWVRMAIQVYQNDMLKGQPSSAKAFALFVALGVIGGALGAWAHSP